MMYDAIKNFAKQFEFEPEIENPDKLSSRAPRFIVVCGMGGSRLAADLLALWKPELPLVVHKDYGLPPLSDDALKNSFIISVSYSGNTEETIDAVHFAHK